MKPFETATEDSTTVIQCSVPCTLYRTGSVPSFILRRLQYSVRAQRALTIKIFDFLSTDEFTVSFKIQYYKLYTLPQLKISHFLQTA